MATKPFATNVAYHFSFVIIIQAIVEVQEVFVKAASPLVDEVKVVIFPPYFFSNRVVERKLQLLEASGNFSCLNQMQIL